MNDHVYAEVTLFLGYRFGADFLLVGANGKGGLRVTCRLPVVDGKPNYAQLEKELPALLLRNSEIRSQYPNLKAADLERSLRFERLDEEQRKSIERRFKANK